MGPPAGPFSRPGRRDPGPRVSGGAGARSLYYMERFRGGWTWIFGENWKFISGVGVTRATDHLLGKDILGYRFHNKKKE